MKHDRGTENTCATTDYTAYGWRDPNAGFCDILAYNCQSGQCDNMPSNQGCTRVQRFSNTVNLYNGLAIGDSLNDNASRANNVKSTIANYMPVKVQSGPTEVRNVGLLVVDACFIIHNSCHQ